MHALIFLSSAQKTFLHSSQNKAAVLLSADIGNTLWAWDCHKVIRHCNGESLSFLACFLSSAFGRQSSSLTLPSSWPLNSLPRVSPFLLRSLCYINQVRDCCMCPSHMGHIYQHQVLMLPTPLLTALLGHATVYPVLVPHFSGFRIWWSGWLTWKYLVTEWSHSPRQQMCLILLDTWLPVQYKS